MKGHEVVTISDSENEEEEGKFLKVYYPSSSKCIEVPINSDDGSLLFADIKVMEPNIFALSLMTGEIARLWKPTNGDFKEPKEKWSTFKVVAVLQDSTNASNSASSSTNNNVSSTRKLSTDFEVPSVSTSTVAATNKESCSSIPKSGAIEMPPTSLTSSKSESVVLQGSTNSSVSTTASMDKNVSSRKSLPDTSSDNQQLPSLSTTVTVAAAINKESCASTSKSEVKKQLPRSATTAESATVKQNALPNSQRIDQSSPSTSLQPINASASNSIPSDAQIFRAFNVSSFNELRDLCCQRNSKFFGCFAIESILDFIFKYLRRTLLAHPDKDLVKLMYYAYRSGVPLRTLNPSALDLDHCDICNLPYFSLHHLVSPEHIIRYQLKHKEEPAEISLILELKNRAFVITRELLLDSRENLYDYFINKFIPKADFDEFKGNFAYRINAARLWIPYMDPLFFEKLLFLNFNYKHHPNLKDIFPSNYRCNDCNRTLQGVNKVVYHIFTIPHLRMVLNQDEIVKLDQAVWYIDYSDDGFFYKTVNENGKRNHEVTLKVTKKRQKKS